MKATLTFNLPEDEYAHSAAILAPKVLSGLGDYARWMRNRLKYEELNEEQAAELTACRDKFYELMDNYLEE